MGYEKCMKQEEEERGYASVEKSICSHCVDDEFLAQIILQNGSTGQCDYCIEQDEELVVVSVDFLMPIIAKALLREFDDPYRLNVPRENGDYVIPTFSTDLALMYSTTGIGCWLIDDVAQAFFTTEWVMASEGSWMNRQPYEELSSLWDEFVQCIKHETRFFFRERASDQSQVPHQILGRIGELIESAGLIRRVDPGRQLYRCRLKRPDEDWEHDAKQLGAPPQDKARAGRMNPAGIAYLYTAYDKATALAEVVDRPPFKAVIGEFRNTRHLNIVDLSDLPPTPSPFDEDRIAERQNLLFLRRFVEEISEPVGKDGSEHIDYVPSQVVCEYLAQVLKSKGQRIDGLAYPSAVMPSGRNLVLFPTERAYTPAFDHVGFVGGEDIAVMNWQDLMQLMQEHAKSHK